MLNDPAISPIKSASWFKAVRSGDALELIKANPNAFVLAYVIAHRARYREGFSADGLEHGEAMLGDFQNYGMSEQNYRTAKEQLTKWHFATFKTTNKGTLGKLMDSRLFDPLNSTANGQTNSRPTDSQRTGNGRVTTNYKVKKEKNEKQGGKNASRNFIPD